MDRAMDCGWSKAIRLQIETIDPDSLAGIKKECEASGVEVMLSLNPETPPEDLTPYLQDTSRFQVLCVNPGLAGQKFLSLTLEKAVWIRYAVPHAIIEIDGGITPETARLAKECRREHYRFGELYLRERRSGARHMKS